MSNKIVAMILAGLILVLAGCAPQATAAPTAVPSTATPIPPTASLPTVAPTLPPVPPTAIPTGLPTSTKEPALAFGRVSLVLPAGLASGISGAQVERNDSPDLAAWARTPGHTLVKLEGYALQGTARQPQIYVFPAMDYVNLRTSAFESIHRLDNIFASPGASVTSDQLPAVPFLNELPIFGTHIQVKPFRNGQGVRFLTQYAQGLVPINNHELIYVYQGLSSDGEYYVIAILPVNLAGLPADSNWNGQQPAPGDAYKKYVNDVVGQLNLQAASAFTPDLNSLDALMQSIQIQ